jgi:hypothetical protein
MLFNSLSEVLDQVEKDLIENKIVLVEDFREEYSFGGIRYNEVSRIHKEIATIKNRATKKYYHIIISRLDSGRYELVSYAS